MIKFTNAQLALCCICCTDLFLILCLQDSAAKTIQIPEFYIACILLNCGQF